MKIYTQFSKKTCFLKLHQNTGRGLCQRQNALKAVFSCLSVNDVTKKALYGWNLLNCWKNEQKRTWDLQARLLLKISSSVEQCQSTEVVQVCFFSIRRSASFPAIQLGRDVAVCGKETERIGNQISERGVLPRSEVKKSEGEKPSLF